MDYSSIVSDAINNAFGKDRVAVKETVLGSYYGRKIVLYECDFVKANSSVAFESQYVGLKETMQSAGIAFTMESAEFYSNESAPNPNEYFYGIWYDSGCGLDESQRRFVIGHELGHIFHGDLEYFNSGKGKTYNGTGVDNVKEIQADVFGMSTTGVSPDFKAISRSSGKRIVSMITGSESPVIAALVSTYLSIAPQILRRKSQSKLMAKVLGLK